jgi:hypothetical protein
MSRAKRKEGSASVAFRYYDRNGRVSRYLLTLGLEKTELTCKTLVEIPALVIGTSMLSVARKLERTLLSVSFFS